MKQCFKIIFKAKFNKFFQRKSILVILSFILVTLTIYLHNQKKITKTTTATSRNQLQSVFNTLKQNEAILLDIELINVIKSNDEFTKLDKSAQSVLINDNFKKIEQYQTEHKSTLITFGVRFNSFEKLDNALQKNHGSNLTIIYKYQIIQKTEKLVNCYIQFENLVLQISILYERGDFYWIGMDDFSLDGKVFGDTPRSLNTFEKITIIDNDSNEFSVPKDVRKFLFDYDHSKFLECNREMASNIAAKHYTQDEIKNKEIEVKMKYLTEKLESLHIHYWLSGGTLLGWYRDCGIIRYTTDVDFNVWAHEYNREIPTYFKGNKNMWLNMALGKPDDSYELRLKSGRFTYDLFYTYKIPGNDTFQWGTYQLLKSVWRRYLPNFNTVCSAELLNHRFMVPCDPVNYLNTDYGANGWQTPKSKLNEKFIDKNIKETKDSYKWPNLKFHEVSTDEKFLKSVKWFIANGNIDESLTVDFFLRGLDVKLSRQKLKNIVSKFTI